MYKEEIVNLILESGFDAETLLKEFVHRMRKGLSLYKSFNENVSDHCPVNKTQSKESVSKLVSKTVGILFGEGYQAEKTYQNLSSFLENHLEEGLWNTVKDKFHNMTGNMFRGQQPVNTPSVNTSNNQKPLDALPVTPDQGANASTSVTMDKNSVGGMLSAIINQSIENGDFQFSGVTKYINEKLLPRVENLHKQWSSVNPSSKELASSLNQEKQLKQYVQTLQKELHDNSVKHMVDMQKNIVQSITPVLSAINRSVAYFKEMDQRRLSNTTPASINRQMDNGLPRSMRPQQPASNEPLKVDPQFQLNHTIPTGNSINESISTGFAAQATPKKKKMYDW